MDEDDVGEASSDEGSDNEEGSDSEEEEPPASVSSKKRKGSPVPTKADTQKPKKKRANVS